MKKIFLSLFFVFCSYFSFSSHFMGGEITWICIKGGPDVGKYIFQMKVYRDCSGITFSQFSQTVTHHNYPSMGLTTPILMNFISVNDISPTGAGMGVSNNSCFNCAAGDNGAVEEYIWRSDPITLAGTPPTQGWHFTWGSSARSSQITNGMADDPWTLRAVMYPYLDATTGLYLPADPCFDSSPAFKELARTIICTGYPFSYSHNASDEELDELTYDWAEPLGSAFAYDPANPSATALTFAPSPPYSVTTPIPGSPTLDAQTGEISYFSNTSGVFVTCVKVEAKKCDQVVAEIYREVQVNLLNCNIYNPPVDGFNDPPLISPAFGPPTPYETIVYAGDLVTFNIQAEDIDTYNGGIPQDVTLDVSGGQFSSDFINPNLCANPPCATFNNGAVPPLTPPFSAPAIVNGVFEWQTDCNHIFNDAGCASTSNVFTFSIKAYDDFCPANGISIATIKITVVPPIPDFRCVSVEDNGDVELTWVYPANALPTTEPIFIWNSTTPAGPYTLIDSVFWPATGYIHNGANADNSINYYYLSNEEGCDTTGLGLNSDTLQSILLTVIPVNLGTSAIFNWNSIKDPLLPTTGPDYDMYFDTSNTFFNYLTTPLLTELYAATKCEDNFELYVEIPDASGCVSRSSLEIANLGDTMSPLTPIITDVSVDGNGRSVISWTSSPDAYDYEIYQYGPQGWETIGSVLAPDTVFSYTLSNADDYSETFSVRALDTCDNTRSRSLEHNSMHLTAVLDVCDHSFDLSWNEYINWPSGVSYYNLIVEETDLNGVSVTVVDTNLNVSNYVVNGLRDKYSYRIYVVAHDNNNIFSALSNQLVVIPALPKTPDYNYIEYASVDHNDGSVELSCIVDISAIIDRYDVYRSLNNDDNFLKIGEVDFSAVTPIYFKDKDAMTSDYFYQYEIYPVDTCGETISAPPYNSSAYLDDTSFAQTILLQAEINLDYSDSPSLQGYTNTLIFNEYDKWLGDVSEYRLYRSINREPFNLLPIYVWDRVNQPDEELRYVDVVTSFGETAGRFCYYIEAVEGSSTPYGAVLGGSLSNIACVSQTPVVFVPNTFTPNGDEHNEVFRPITYFVSEEGYSFTIYNREGEKIFETDNPQKGWDGSYKGAQVQDGNYVYHIQFFNGVGSLTEKIDVVSVVR